MYKSIFFKKKNIKVKSLFPNFNFKENFIVNDVRPLDKAQNFDITFFESLAYLSDAKKLKVAYALLLKNLKVFYQII